MAYSSYLFPKHDVCEFCNKLHKNRITPDKCSKARQLASLDDAKKCDQRIKTKNKQTPSRIKTESNYAEYIADNYQ